MEELIGRGGTAVVWRAYDEARQREVALKILHLEGLSSREAAQIRRRFLREARALSRLQHPAIVPVLDFGEWKGVPYLVMPLMRKGTLKQHLNGRPIPWEKAVRFLLPVFDALEYAHRLGIIHRDIKPSNILLDEQGHPLLGDFGIAFLKSSTTKLTATGMTLGTPEYMAPEQALGEKVDERADVYYALACVLYEMVTGTPPYTADTPVGVMLKHLQPSPKPVSRTLRGVPREMDKVLLKALAKSPSSATLRWRHSVRRCKICCARNAPLLTKKPCPRSSKRWSHAFGEHSWQRSLSWWAEEARGLTTVS